MKKGIDFVGFGFGLLGGKREERVIDLLEFVLEDVVSYREFFRMNSE